MLFRVLVYAVALSLTLLQGWFVHRLLSPGRHTPGRYHVCTVSEHHEEGTKP